MLLPKKIPQVTCEKSHCLRVHLQLVKERSQEHTNKGDVGGGEGGGGYLGTIPTYEQLKEQWG